MPSRTEVLLACAITCAIHTGCAQIIGIENLPPLEEPPPVEIDAGPQPVQRTIAVADKVDILFVIDDTFRMTPAQRRLADGLPSLFDSLPGQSGLPDLHVGVISTDLAAHPTVLNCGADDNDNGALQSSFTDDPNFPQCSDDSLAIDGAFIRDAPDPASARVTNYTGDLTDVLSCMVVLGENGCGFEQPLAAMRRAFENPINAGFLRSDAMLAVVFFSEEDDCSAFDPAMYDPTMNSKDGPLGPFDSFRCFEFGVECDPDAPRVLGDKLACKPREDSSYIYDVNQYVDFLRGLKPDPQQIVVAGLVGVDLGAPDAPLEVITELKPLGEVFSLVPACEVMGTDINDEPVVVSSAAPAVRLRAVLDAFPGRSALGSVCDEDPTGALGSVGGLIARSLEQRWCLPADVDRMSDVPGVQDACEVREQSYDGDTLVDTTALARCTSNTLPCWQFVFPSDRCTIEAPVELVIQRPGPAPANAMIEVRCNLD